MCITVIVQYTCGCLGRTLGRDKCRYLSHNESLLAELQGAGLRLWARAIKINTESCAKMRAKNEWRPYSNRRQCGKCMKAKRERKERKAKVIKAKGLGRMRKARLGKGGALKTVKEAFEPEGEDVQVALKPDDLESVDMRLGGLNIEKGRVLERDEGHIAATGLEDVESQSGEETETDDN